VHDYLTQCGGAERVVLAMARAFPDAPIYTSLYCPETTFPEFRQLDVRPLWTNALRSLRADHRRGLPMYPVAFSRARIDAEVTLCSSSGFAHGVRTSGRKVVYCYTPARWLYDGADAYLARWPSAIRLALRGAAPLLRAWDRRAMGDADQVLTSSTAVAGRIRAAYGIDAEVLPPPGGITVGGARRAIRDIRPGYVLSVGRLLAYKNVDALIAAVARMPGRRLVIAGDGPERSRLEAAAGPDVVFTGEVDDAELRWLYSGCAGVASASYEDYGLTPLEAAAYGKPAATLRFGGFLDTVVEGETGVFFDAPDGEAACSALTRLLDGAWDRDCITAHAARFDEQAYCARLRAHVRGDEASSGDHAGAAVASLGRPVVEAAGRAVRGAVAGRT
jgi:glycosyltransferase involved in cell wall biosynthesis